MSALAEDVLMAHLTDIDSLAVIAAEGLPEEAIPTEAYRPIYTFALDYYYNCGRTMAPSDEVLRTEFHKVVIEQSISFTDPTDSVEWALAHLRDNYAHRRGEDFTYDMAKQIADAAQDGSGDVAAAIHENASRLIALSMELERRDQVASLTAEADQISSRYQERSQVTTEFSGLGLGLMEVDTHTYGIHPGELAVIAAGTKTGKSWMADYTVLREWQAGRNPVLFTLENSIEMTLDRIACLATGVDGKDFERGKSSEADIGRVNQWLEWVKEAESTLWVLKPQEGQRTPQHLIRKAAALGATSVIIDQLSYVEHPEGSRVRTNERYRDNMLALRNLLNATRTKIPGLLLHQIKREGLKEAHKRGYLELTDFAESADIERIVDFGFLMYQSPAGRIANEMLLQLAAARRCDIENWKLHWEINCGAIQVKRRLGRRLGD